MRALNLAREHEGRAGAHDALDAEPAAIAAGTARIRQEPQGLDDAGRLHLGHLASAVMRVAVIDADRRRDAVFAHLGAPAAAQGPEISEVEFLGLRIEAVE